MKNFIKTILAASLMLAGASLQAITPETVAKLDTEREAQEKLRAQETIPTIVITPANEGKLPTSFEQFSQLPRDVQMQILGSINESFTPLAAVKRLGQLRRVNQQVKNFIESRHSGKYLMQKIADRFPQENVQIFMAAFKLATPGSLAWLKEQFNALGQDEMQRIQFNFALESAIGNHNLNGAEILELVGDPNYIVVPRYHGTMLFLAAQTNNLPLIKELINAGADVNIPVIIEGNLGQTRKTILEIPRLKDEIRDFLRSQGAKTSAELGQGQ